MARKMLGTKANSRIIDVDEIMDEISERIEKYGIFISELEFTNSDEEIGVRMAINFGFNDEEEDDDKFTIERNLKVKDFFDKELDFKGDIILEEMLKNKIFGYYYSFTEENSKDILEHFLGIDDIEYSIHDNNKDILCVIY